MLFFISEKVEANGRNRFNHLLQQRAGIRITQGDKRRSFKFVYRRALVHTSSDRMDVRLGCLDSIGVGDHAMLLYESDSEESSLLSYFLERKLRDEEGAYVYFRTPHPEYHARRFSKNKQLSRSMKKGSLNISDAGKNHKSEAQHVHLQRKISEMKHLVKHRSYKEWVLVTDAPRLYYDNFKEELITEQALKSDLGSILCLYWVNGIASIGCRFLSKIVDLHSDILFSERFAFARN